MPQQTETTTQRKRGRPRPVAAIRRDADIFRRLEAQPMTRNELVNQTGLSNSIVYLSLDRLRKQGRVKLCQGQAAERLWTVRVDSPCP